MSRLEGKVAIVTGGGSGIGKASATLFAKEGAKVVVADWLPEWGEETVRVIRAAGGEAVFVKTDVSETTDVQNMIKTAVDTYGKLNVLFNNAGILELEDVSITECKEENYDKLLSINLKGVFLGMKYAIPEMLKVGGGSIINTSSGTAIRGWHHFPSYAASKGGIIGLSRQVATDFITKNIRVNCINPMHVLTPMLEKLQRDPDVWNRILALHPARRLGTPEEIAQIVLFLASDESSYLNGEDILTDGGMLTVGYREPD